MVKQQIACTAIYAVDDHQHTIPFWTTLQRRNILPGVTYYHSNKLDDAIRYAVREGPAATLFVLDCNIALDPWLFQDCRDRLGERYGLDIDRFRPHYQVLRGVYVGGLLRVLRPDCSVILLTAWDDIIRAVPGIGSLLDVACDEIVGKHGAKELLASVRRYLAPCPAPTKADS